MLTMRLVTRGNLPQYAATVQRLHTSSIALESSSSSSSDSDQKSSKKKVKAKPVLSEEQKQYAREETTLRLNSLLDQMIKVKKPTKPIELPVAPVKPKREPKPKPYEDEVIGAAKNVATALGGDVKKTESELLNKLLSGENEKSEDESAKPKSSPMNLNDLISGMKIDRSSEDKTQRFSRTARVQEMARKFQSMNAGKSDRRQPEPRNFDLPAEVGNLYGGSLVGIFDRHAESDKKSEAPQLSTWEHLEKREFRLALSHPPENIFQELIQWTEQGKLWKFPIDNEQGLEAEQSVHFSEHVFLEHHLKGWCPKGGPIRHFMELVCVGLSKNPYMTAQKKRDHLKWYEDFFNSKRDLLKEIGAIEETMPQEKQIEAQ